MKDKKEQMLELLQDSRGFNDPERWVDYGISHNFVKVKIENVEKCPDCLSNDFKFLGQFIYYSSLVKLQECVQCGLVFSDTRIDPEIIHSHFQQAYKDESYFLQGRSRIFKQISNLTDKAAKQGARVLDIGGAKGHLLAMIKKSRADLSMVLNDLSEDACRHAESEYGFETVLGGIEDLEKISEKFDVLIMSDVIYYEPELRRLWNLLPRLVSESGTVIIRVPNKLHLIRLWLLTRNMMLSKGEREMQDNIKFLNPEHIFIFSQHYLLTRLKKLGFSHVAALPSELLAEGQGNVLRRLYYYISKIISIITFGRLVITPSLLVIASNIVSRDNRS